MGNIQPLSFPAPPADKGVAAYALQNTSQMNIRILRTAAQSLTFSDVEFFDAAPPVATLVVSGSYQFEL